MEKIRMSLPFSKVVTPPCPDPECGSKDTTTGRSVRISAGLGLAIGGSLLCYLAGFIYPLGRILIPFLLVGGIIICFVPPLAKYCCLECDAHWNPDNPQKIWRPRPPGL